jgi:hypothetical protein
MEISEEVTEEVIYHLSKNIKTKLSVSDIDGIGVFAIKDISEGEEVFKIWEHQSGIYAIPKNKLNLIPTEVLKMLDMYFIGEANEHKLIRLFEGLNLISHNISYCNSAWPNKENQNISNKGIALRDIKAGEEILEWYTKNINLANSK